ncbi:hypothetical protein [Actinosynnema sp. NPDC023587]|uniref:hypothetical protein n=1 Tax=Actinosynnema sp. NPDC023587 TaxID=3154695 RepID=UPI0033EE660C
MPSALLLWSGSVVGGYWFTGLVALAGWVVVAVAWLVLVVLAIRALPAPRARHPGRLWAFLAVPLVAVATSGISGSGVTRHASFEVHRSSLEALAAEVRASPRGLLADRSFALLTVSSARREPGSGCVTMSIAGAGFLNSTGYAHCPDHVPASTRPGTDGHLFKHLDGPWYTYVLEW